MGARTANVVRDRSGRPLRTIAVILDITEHKEREEKVHLLMREVNHRAKNMLRPRPGIIAPGRGLWG
jgi:hypothetical protein